MHRFHIGCSLLMFVCVACTAETEADAGVPRDGGDIVSDGGEHVDGGAAVERDALSIPALVAEAVCARLYSCCSDDDIARYVSPMLSSERLSSFHDDLPPGSADECVTTFSSVFNVTPFGDFARAVAAGSVTLDQAELDACFSELENAACGEPLRNALTDSTCFGFGAPLGGEEQRRPFVRTAGPGASCVPIADGVGAAFFGTCDPTIAFCCYANDDEPELGCAFPYGEGNAPRTGVCQAVAGQGESCSQIQPLQLCATGDFCDEGLCATEGTMSLSAGETCAEDFVFLGTCTDSWCDVLGDGTCQEPRPDGDPCFSADECAGGMCAGGQCTTETMCNERPD